MPIYKTVDKSFFKKWTPDMAYVLGFFMADGYVTTNVRGAHYFNIQICDGGLLRKIKKHLQSNHKIRMIHRKGNENNIYRLQIGSKSMCSDLRNLGVTEKKTKRMLLPSVPDRFLGDFTRGYFDGDGHVWTGYIHKERNKQLYTIQTAFTSCAKDFVSSLQARLENKNISGSVYTRESIVRLQYSVKSSLLLYHLMYDNLQDDLFLIRKKVVFEKFMKMRP